MWTLRGSAGPLVVSGVLVLVSACASTSVAPPSLAPAHCSIDHRLPGKWKSTRSSQMGPASMTFEFNCDCTYLSRGRVLAFFIREKGAFWVEDEALHLTRASGDTTVWPLSFEGDVLMLTEYQGEVHDYHRKASRTCAAP